MNMIMYFFQKKFDEKIQINSIKNRIFKCHCIFFSVPGTMHFLLLKDLRALWTDQQNIATLGKCFLKLAETGKSAGEIWKLVQNFFAKYFVNIRTPHLLPVFNIKKKIQNKIFTRRNPLAVNLVYGFPTCFFNDLVVEYPL